MFSMFLVQIFENKEQIKNKMTVLYFKSEQK